MVILVTGGAGFIGSHVVDLMVAEGHEVRVLDLLDAGVHASPPDYLNQNADYRVLDVRDTEAVMSALSGVEAVSHHAAMVGLGVDLSDILDYVSNNDLGTAALLHALHRTKFAGRLVLASSMVVYGEGAYRCEGCERTVRPDPRIEEDLANGRFEPRCPRCHRSLHPIPIGEGARLDPRNIYAATKLHQEQLCTAFGRETGVSVTSLRYHNVYGPRMPRDTPYAGVAAIFRSALEAGEAPSVYEDGGQLRNFVHVRDVARANAVALSADAPGPFNIASPEPRTVLDMARTLAGAFGAERLHPTVTGRYRLGDVRHVFASPERARAELGFEAVVGFEQGIRDLASAPLRGAEAAVGPGPTQGATQLDPARL